MGNKKEEKKVEEKNRKEEGPVWMNQEWRNNLPRGINFPVENDGSKRPMQEIHQNDTIVLSVPQGPGIVQHNQTPFFPAGPKTDKTGGDMIVIQSPYLKKE